MAFDLADTDHSCLVDEGEFMVLYELLVSGTVTGMANRGNAANKLKAVEVKAALRSQHAASAAAPVIDRGDAGTRDIVAPQVPLAAAGPRSDSGTQPAGPAAAAAAADDEAVVVRVATLRRSMALRRLLAAPGAAAEAGSDPVAQCFARCVERPSV